MGNKVSPYFKIKIALDTQLLAYIIDDTFPSFTTFFKYLSKSPFVDLVCSRFVTYEYIGIRKLEHYLRTLYHETGGKMNFSSALKYRNGFKAPELDYSQCHDVIKANVEGELRIINDEFGIEYNDNVLHDNIWAPHQDLVLGTKISKEDSMVLISSVFPNEIKKESHAVFITNDDQFYDAYKDGKKGDPSIVNEIFATNNLQQPEVFNIKKISLNSGKKMNLTTEIGEEEIIKFAQEFIIKEIKKKNKKFLIGTTIRCQASQSTRSDLLCFRLGNNVELPEKFYPVIIYKQDEEIGFFTHEKEIGDFYCHGRIETFPYSANEDDPKTSEISTKIKDEPSETLTIDQLPYLQQNGNFLFVHPDNDLW